MQYKIKQKKYGVPFSLKMFETNQSNYSQTKITFYIYSQYNNVHTVYTKSIDISS